ncbi:hypothetical protein [Hyphococcus sp.]|uniref:hypothetical protein n=1 Tax=Hyphococcus sp. TaxID=2038636 RepID=UPI0035C73922
MSEDKTHPDHSGADDEGRGERVRQEDFVPVIVGGDDEGGRDRRRSGDHRNGPHRGRRFERDYNSPIEIEIGDAKVRVTPKTDRVLLNIVLEALRGRR